MTNIINLGRFNKPKDASLKSGRQVREKASEVDRVVGGNLKIVWGNLQAMTDYGAIFKNYQAKMGFLESKLSKNIMKKFWALRFKVNIKHVLC
jgi:hypothetical protein